MIPEIQQAFYYERKIILDHPQDTVKYQHREDYGPEEYTIDVDEQGIRIGYGSQRALYYAHLTFDSILRPCNGKQMIPYCHIRDYPSFQTRGIIEGFYGKPWSHESRLDLICFISKQKMNTFFYAPKDDPYHRDQWRLPYPVKEFDRLRELVSCCRENFVDFVFSVSPGKDIAYSSDEDFALLLKKFCDVIDLGVPNVALLLDDISKTLGNREDTQQFDNDYGKAQVYLANRLKRNLKEKYPNLKFTVCPTEYAGITDTHYKKIYRDSLDREIAVIWTGPEVIPGAIHTREAQITRQQYGHDILLWDNYPVNDGSHLLKFDPLCNREDSLFTEISGIVANPMNETEASKLSLMTIADYCWNTAKYAPDHAFRKAVAAFDGDNAPFYDTLMELFHVQSLRKQAPEKLEELVKGAIEHQEYASLRAYLHKIRKFSAEFDQLKNIQLREELSIVREKIKLTVRLGLKSLDYLEGKGVGSLKKAIKDYLANTCPFAGSYILDLAEAAQAQSMRLEDKIGQLFMIEVDSPTSAAIPCLPETLQSLHAGNVLFSGTYPSLSALQEAMLPYRALSPIPPFIGADHEGGSHTLVNERFSQLFSAKYLGKIADKYATFNDLYIMLMEMKTLGFNYFLAPVLNVGDSLHASLCERIFGNTVNEEVLQQASRVYKSAGVVGCAKYFPVVGDTDVVANYDGLAQQLKAFSAGIKAGIQAVYVSNARVRELDEELPACRSEAVINGLLKGKMGYTGMTVSEIDNTNGFADFRQGLSAGIDFFVAKDPSVLSEVLAKRNTLTQEEQRLIDQSTAKILKEKEFLTPETIDESKFDFYQKLIEEIREMGRQAIANE